MLESYSWKNNFIVQASLQYSRVFYSKYLNLSTPSAKKRQRTQKNPQIFLRSLRLEVETISLR